MNATLTEQQALINLSAKNLNADLEEAYGSRTDETAKRLREVLTIVPGRDTMISTLVKMFNYYFGCGRVPSEAVQAGSLGYVERSEDVIVGEVRLKCDKKLIDGSPVGYYRINVPHFIPDKYAEIQGYQQAFGNVAVIYVFADKRQIKLFVPDEKEGYRAINHLLKAVDPSKLLGTAEQHAYVGRPPKTKKPHRLTGLMGRANRVRIKNPDKTSYSHQL